MKRFVLILVAVAIIICSTACSHKRELPDTVVINENEYRRAFVNELYPAKEGFPSSADAKIEGVSFYNYTADASFDTYIAYDGSAKPNVYFLSEQYDSALSFYNDAENYRFFCIVGNIHDENDQEKFEIEMMGVSMFERFLEFSKENDNDPFSSSNNEDGLIKIQLDEPEKRTDNEVHLYKESRDAAFKTSTAYSFVKVEDKLYYFYQYDYSDTEKPVMLVKELPEDINNYFYGLLGTLNVKYWTK